MAKRRNSTAAKKSRPKSASPKKKPASKRSAAKRLKPQSMRVYMPDEEAEIEKVFASRLPSHGSARREARRQVAHHGVSLTHVSNVMSKVTKTTISTSKLAALLRKKGVPVIKINYDDPPSYRPDAEDLMTPRQSGLAGIVMDSFDFWKGFPELMHGTTTGDMFMPRRGIEILEGIAAYRCLKRNRDWSQLKRWYRRRD